MLIDILHAYLHLQKNTNTGITSSKRKNTSTIFFLGIAFPIQFSLLFNINKIVHETVSSSYFPKDITPQT